MGDSVEGFFWFGMILVAVVLTLLAVYGFHTENECKEACEDFGGKYTPNDGGICYKDGEIYEVVKVDGDYKVGRIAVSDELK